MNLLRENTCIMIGLSITDPNLRRLLDIAVRKNVKPKHYVILKRPAFEQKINDNDTIRQDVISKYASVDQQLQEKSLLELGLKVIWIENHDEIPGILDTIKS